MATSCRVVRVVAAVCTLALVTTVAFTVSVGTASAALPVPARQVWVQGDSVLLGAVSTVQAELRGAGWTPTVTAFGGLQLTAATGLFRQQEANLGSVVVIELGNNFCCDLSQFPGEIDAAMAAIGPRHVIWLTTALFEPRQQQINDLIRAGAARWANAEVADWGAEVAANPQAVGHDGLHLTVAGRVLLAGYIHAHLDAWYRQFSGPSRPLVTGFGPSSAVAPSAQQATPGLPAGMSATTDGQGYWIAGSDGTVEAFGDAPVFGSVTLAPLSAPIVGIVAAPDHGGYWLVSSAGGVYAFGDVVAHGSLATLALKQPVVGMAATPDGAGYWLVAADGGVFAFGDARFEGSTGGVHLRRPIESMASTPTGRGYWFVAADGGVFTFGDAHFFGSAVGAGEGPQPATYVGITPAPNGQGYWLLGETPP